MKQQLKPEELFSEFIDERINFFNAVLSKRDWDSEFYKTLRDFEWVKRRIENEKMGEETYWDDIVSILSPYMIKMYNILLDHSKDDSLPFSMRLDSKRICDDLQTIYNYIVSKCNQPFTSTLIFINN